MLSFVVLKGEDDKSGVEMELHRLMINRTQAGRSAAFRLRIQVSWATLLGLLAVLFLALGAQAQQKTFQLSGASLSLLDVSSDVDVFFSSMRFNRISNVWNFEVSLTNHSPRQLNGPVVLSIDSFTGTSGPLLVDGVDGEGKSFYDLSSTVPSGNLVPGTRSTTRTLTLGFTGSSPKLVTRVFVRPPALPAALAITRTLDEAGQPLPDVQVIESGPNGVVTNRTDPVFGVVTLGQAVGAHTWQFSAPGRLPVWRQMTLTTNDVEIVADPRLALRSTNSFSLTPIAGGQITNGDASVQLSFPPASVLQATTATLTSLTGQTLPAFLPQGWSPLRSFWAEFGSEPVLPSAGRFTLTDTLRTSETAALVRWNPTAVRWEVLQVVAGNGSSLIAASVPGSGAYSILVPDVLPTAPPAPLQGSSLAGVSVTAPDPVGLTAAGQVQPSTSPASLVPEEVTGTATVSITNGAGPIASGLLLRGQVREAYTLRNSFAGLPPSALGLSRTPPGYESFMVAYQRPGLANSRILQAQFPLRPFLLFGSEELDQATVTMDVLPPTPFSGGVLDTNGGLVASQGIGILAGAGDLSNQQAVQVQRFDPTNFLDFTTNGLRVVAAFQLTVAGLAPGHHLVAQLDPLPTNGIFVLARVLYQQGLYGLQPVERLTSDTQGRASTGEPSVGERLTGIIGSGQYLLLQVPAMQALVSGVAKNSAAQPAAGMPVQIPGQPWLALSSVNGSFQLLASTGQVQVLVTDLTSGDTGSVNVAVVDPQTPVSTTLSSLARPPQVVSVSPTNNAASVSRVVPVAVEFDKPINAATVIAGGIVLLDGSNAPVAASLSLNLSGTVATLLPVSELAASTRYTVFVSTNITDLAGRGLPAPSQIAFSTESDALNRAAADLFIYEPTNGLAPVFGTPGAAEPNSPVILANETSGQTVTILSRADGSFSNSLPADVDDHISATLVNRNGTRTRLSASRQIFQDGSVGLFNGGGVLDVQGVGGGASITIAAGAIADRTRLKLDMVDSNQLSQATANMAPLEGKLLGRGVHVAGSGSGVNGEANVSFPVAQSELEQLGLPPGGNPTNATYALVAVTKVDGQPAYMVLNTLVYENGTLVTHSPPFPGAQFLMEPANDGVQAAVQGVQIASQPVSALLGPFDFLMAPLILAFQTQPVTFTGAVVESGPAGFSPLPGAVVTLRPNSGPISTVRQGRLDPGQLYTLAQARGVYALVQPRPLIDLNNPEPSFDYILSATHPSVFGRIVYKAANPPTLNLSITDLILPATAGSVLANEPPGVLINHVPTFPPIGTNADVTVTMTHPTGSPTLDDLQVESVTPIPPETDVSLTDVVGPTNRVTEDVSPQIRRVHFSLTCNRAAQVVLKLRVSVNGGPASIVHYAIAFGAQPVVGTNPSPPDKNDRSGPRVLFSEPPQEASAVDPTHPIRLVFNEPLDSNTVNSASVSLDPTAGVPLLQLSKDQTEVLITYSGLQLGQAYHLRFGDQVTDLPPNSNPFDQSGTNTHNLFELDFQTAPKNLVPLPGIVSGAGVVIRGTYAFALDRLSGSGDGKLLVFDLSDPAHPVKAAEHVIPGTPRDLVLIPSYAYKRRPSLPAETNDLLAVSFGDLGASFDGQNFIGGGQSIRILNINDPTQPVNLVTRQVTLSFTTIVPRLRWNPPILTYLETSSEVQDIGFINLQTMILSEYMTPDEFNASVGSPGLDLNGDGDFVDPGEKLPLPDPNSPDFSGKVFSYTLNDSTQIIRDFDYDFQAGYLGAVLGPGLAKDPLGLPTSTNLPACYRTLLSGSLTLPRDPSSFVFTNREPKRVFSLFGVGLTDTNGVTRTSDLAFVSVNGDSNTLEVLDITDPTAPKRISTIIFKTEDGFIQSVDKRSDGLLLVSTTENVAVLDLAHLLDPIVNGVQPAVVSRLTAIGSGAFTFGLEDYGVMAESLATKSQILQIPPQLEFVAFPDVAPFDPQTLVGQNGAIQERLTHRVAVDSIGPARFKEIQGTVASTLTTPSPKVHYYVLIHAPGGDPTDNAQLDVLLESLNDQAYPLRNKGAGFPPVRAASSQTLNDLSQQPRGACDAPIHPLKAFRLSNDKRSPFYNLYLSHPFALSYENISQSELANLQSALNREILWSGHFLRASLDESASGLNAVGAYASSVDSSRLTVKLGAYALAESLPADYIMGPNPPPVTGAAVVPGTFGTLAAHSGEMRIDTVDMALPSRRMPIVFQRSTGAQDLYDGPFGRGWDFNYNQRLVELKGTLLDSAAQIPLVLRGGTGDEIAKTNDLLFYPGDGRTLLYRFAGTNPPPEIASDPLVQAPELNWTNTAAAYYLPPTGIFDFFVRFSDGQFGRLTPDGTQFWYGSRGKLEHLYNRYETNRQELIYNEKGELIQIEDRSVSVPRFLQIGYWRPAAEVVDATLDSPTSDGSKIGKIARLKDYTGRDIQFDYTPCGELEVRKGVQVTKGLEPSQPDRAETHYLAAQTVTEKANGLRGLVAGSSAGAKLFAADSFQGDPAIPSVANGSGATGSVGVGLHHQNTAAAVAAGTGSTTVTSADTAITDIGLDASGLPSVMHYSGYNDQDAFVNYQYTNGLLGKITYPEGNSVTYIYDSANSVLRSRGNLVAMTRDRGQLPGNSVPDATFSYEPKYNLSKTSTDFNGNQINYGLDSHGKDVGTIQYIAGPGITQTSGQEEFQYDDQGQLRVHKTIEGFETDLDYFADTGFKKSETQVDLGTTSFDYSAHLTHDGDLGLPTTITPPSGAPIQLTYNEHEDLIQRTRDLLQNDQMAYDLNGHLVTYSKDLDASHTLVETRGYEQNGFLTNITLHGVETANGQQDLSYSFLHDQVYRVKEIVHPAPVGSATQVSTRFESFDHLGRYHQLTEGAYSEQYTYDRNGNLKSVTRGTTTDTYEYDGYDRLIFVRKDGQSGREVTGRTYYGNGDLNATTVTDGTGQLVSQVTRGIDAVGRVTSEQRTTDGNPATTTYEYNGLILTITDPAPANERTIITFDHAGRKVSSADSIRTLTWPYNGSELTELKSAEVETDYETFFENYNSLEQFRQVRDEVGILVTMTPRFDGVYTSTSDARHGTTSYSPTLLGEASARIKPNGIEFHYTFDEHRRLASVKDKQGLGHGYVYDDTMRLKEQDLRTGGPVLVSQFDARTRLPLQVSTPGGSQTLTYDDQGRLTVRVINFSNGSRIEGFTNDPLNRVTGATYPPNSSAGYQFDKLGPLRQASFSQRGQTYTLSDTIRSDGTRLTLVYPQPESVTINEGRDSAGRLQTVSVSGGDPVVLSTSFAAADLVGTQNLGPNLLTVENTYDGRKRLLARRYSSGTNVLAEARYVYDATDNLVARQFVHRSGRTDFFQYDAGQRLLRADMDARPQIALASARAAYTGFQIPAEAGGAWSPGFFGRAFGYDGVNGLDLFTGVTVVDPDFLAPTNFALSYGGPDGFLQMSVIDGLQRPSDALGNTLRCRLFTRPSTGSTVVPLNATLNYNGLSELEGIDRDDGVSILYNYQHDGLCFYRSVTGAVPGATNETAFVYDGPLLIGEYDRSNGANQLRARYYYADADVPVAADLRDTGGVLRRYYVMRDSLGSVMGLVDTNGAVVERYFYDAWGQPEIQAPDHVPPHIRRVLTAADGDGLIVEFTERVLPPLGGALNQNLRSTMQDLAGAFGLKTSSQTLNPEVSYEENLAGFVFGSALRLRPGVSISGAITLTLQPGRLQDEWSNPNPPETNSFTFNATPGSILFTAQNPAPTDLPPLARSAFGWPFLFQGQYFDYDAGFVYMRARFYDPGSGLFLQLDPDSYTDSVNLYAAFGQNPATLRDPSGRGLISSAAEEEAEIAQIAARRSKISNLPLSQEIKIEQDIRKLVGKEAKGAVRSSEQVAEAHLPTARPTPKINEATPHAPARPRVIPSKVSDNGEVGATARSTDATSPSSARLHAELERQELRELEPRELAHELHRRNRELFESIRTARTADELADVARRNNVRFVTEEEAFEHYRYRLPARRGDNPNNPAVKIFAGNRVVRAVEEEGFSIANEEVLERARAGNMGALEDLRTGVGHSIGARKLIEVRGSYDAIRDFPGPWGGYETHYLDHLIRSGGR